jgi:hypothetical protein
MFLEKAQAAAGDSAADNWRLFPADFRDKNEASAYHHEQVWHAGSSSKSRSATALQRCMWAAAAENMG